MLPFCCQQSLPGEGRLGSLCVLSQSSPFSGLAILGSLRRPSSRCTTERDLVSDDKAGQSLTGQCHFSPSTGWATEASPPPPRPAQAFSPDHLLRVLLQRRGLWMYAPYKPQSRSAIKESDPSIWRHLSTVNKCQRLRSLQGVIPTAANSAASKGSRGLTCTE